MMRRQSTAIVRLTVVTVMSILGTVTTGVLGMNVFDEAAKPWHYRMALVIFSLVGTSFITYIVLRRSQSLAHFFESVADTRVTLRRQWNALKAVFWER
jgi:Mg2+ and Co2+ transporter CorA